MTTKLTHYRGRLSANQAAEGIAFARKNASRLIADAELLLENNRHASGAALAILAIEELGKVQAIKDIILHLDPAELKRAWRDYRSHRAKNVHWILPKLAAEGARTLQQVKVAADPAADHTMLLDTVKQLSFYTDCYNDKPRWSDPDEAVDPKFSAAIIAIARMLNYETDTTVRELELWSSIVAPHYGKSTMVDALLKFQKLAFAEGLSATSPEAMESFVRGRPIMVRETDN